jgi:penicillin amidase
MLGRSSDLGWGTTSSYLDDQDVYIEEVNPSDASQYRVPNGWAVPILNTLASN